MGKNKEPKRILKSSKVLAKSNEVYNESLEKWSPSYWNDIRSKHFHNIITKYTWNVYDEEKINSPFQRLFYIV